MGSRSIHLLSRTVRRVFRETSSAPPVVHWSAPLGIGPLEGSRYGLLSPRARGESRGKGNYLRLYRAHSGTERRRCPIRGWGGPPKGRTPVAVDAARRSGQGRGLLTSQPSPLELRRGQVARRRADRLPVGYVVQEPTEPAVRIGEVHTSRRVRGRADRSGVFCATGAESVALPGPRGCPADAPPRGRRQASPGRSGALAICANDSFAVVSESWQILSTRVMVTVTPPFPRSPTMQFLGATRTSWTCRTPRTASWSARAIRATPAHGVGSTICIPH